MKNFWLDSGKNLLSTATTTNFYLFCYIFILKNVQKNKVFLPNLTVFPRICSCTTPSAGTVPPPESATPSPTTNACSARGPPMSSPSGSASPSPGLKVLSRNNPPALTTQLFANLQFFKSPFQKILCAHCLTTLAAAIGRSSDIITTHSR